MPPPTTPIALPRFVVLCLNWRAVPTTPVALPAGLAATESSYRRTADELQLALETARSSLAPATVATVERSLRVIDSAIVEARTALALDPNNQVLADILASNYERKLDLLRRAAELTSKS